MLFAGTLRQNLDRFDEHTDAEVWASLEQTIMSETVKARGEEGDHVKEFLQQAVVEKG